MLSCRLWAGVAVSGLPCGCMRAGFSDPGNKPSDSAVETSWSEGGVAGHGVVEALPIVPAPCDQLCDGSPGAQIVSYTGAGSPRWRQRVGGLGQDVPFDLVAGGGNVLLAAVFHKTADPGGGPLTSRGGGDVLAASYTGTGKPCWQLSFGDADDEAGYGVAVQGSGQLVLAGWYYDTLNLWGAPLSSKGGMDIFVAGFTR